MIAEAPSRHEQILSYTGEELAAAIAPGNLLVSSRDASVCYRTLYLLARISALTALHLSLQREKLELMAKHPEIRSRLDPWTKACFLMISTGDDRQHMMAVSMSAPVEDNTPPADVGLSSQKRRRWKELTVSLDRNGAYKLRHYDGGPMNRSDPICVVHVTTPGGAREWARLTKEPTQVVPPNWLVGSFRAVEDAVKVGMSSTGAGQDTSKGKLLINVVWGCGGWGMTQVLAESA